ncbi:AAA domain-containing protein [Alcaligenaceae bacterium A4P071]|nr:AAA domain-containing protein [Alcaligenaceae bacterium A4P071]
MTDPQPLETFGQLLTRMDGTLLPIDDVLLLMLPLLRETAALHGQGRVANLSANDVVQGAQRSLCLRDPAGAAPQYANDRIKAIQPQPGSALNIVGELRVIRDADDALALDDLAVQTDPDRPVGKPVYLPGLAAWERALGHHDEISDIFQLGEMLACLACGLDLRRDDDVRAFARSRTNLFDLNPRLNPVLAQTIVEMTALNRHDRATELSSIVQRLERWREQPVGLDLDRVLDGAQGPAPRRTAVLEHLRDRLFDLSRRNRLLYFRPTQANVNLTIASVPLVMHVESIQPEQLCTWQGGFAEQVLSGETIGLQRWLRFDDQPYLPGSLDRLIQDTRRDRAEFGFSNLRLVVAFMHWHNLKETPEERIVSPLLWLPVELSKKKGVRDQYVLKCDESEAEFNPVLRHQLRQLYDIQLPETVDLKTTSLPDIHRDLAAQIRQTEPGVSLTLQSKPTIKLIHQKAMQRLQQFQKRRAAGAGTAPVRPDFSYDAHDYRPLGVQLFRETVQPSPSPLRGALGAEPLPRTQPPRMMAATAPEHTTYALTDEPGHRHAWDIDLTQVTLANFNYKKMSLVQDYAQLIEQPANASSFDRMFSIEPRDIDVDTPPAIPIAEQWNVVPADATQNNAVSLARTGRHFIIQGPPGTGKSQTITNLIADYAGRGLRVLFVCEKRAALDVVFHRLQQSGLDDLCCLIHDSQTDKKAFILNLRECYERWVAEPLDGSTLTVARQSTLNALSQHLAHITRFEQAMSVMPEALATSVRALIRILIAAPGDQPHLDAAARERLPDWAEWQRHLDLTRRVYATVRDRLNASSFAQHTFSRLSADLVRDDVAYNRATAFVDHATVALDAISASLPKPASLLSLDTRIDEAPTLTPAVQAIAAFNLAAHLDLLDSRSTDAAALRGEQAQLRTLADADATASAAARHWREPLSIEDTQAAIALEQRLGSSALRWINPAWWRLRGELKRRYDFSQQAVRPTYRTILSHLAAHHHATTALAAARHALNTRYGIQDGAPFFDALETVARALPTAPSLQRWIETLRTSADPIAIAQDALVPADALATLHTLVPQAMGPTSDLNTGINASSDTKPNTGLTVGELAAFVPRLRNDLSDLPDLLPLLREVHDAEPRYVAALQTHAFDLDTFQILIADEALARVYRTLPELVRFDERALMQAVEAVDAAERTLLKHNAEVVESRWHRIFLDHLKQSGVSATPADEAGKQFKKDYARGRRELEHEFGKTMRYRSIRELAGGESGLVINDLKPIWLMSPLSVSDTLPLQSQLFDVVIFDEASQIQSEEAVPALNRAPQVVVVGDEMQLPPTTFFSAAGDEGDEQVIATEDGEQIAINLDADSLLSQAARNLPASLLAWHYRSRHEALISFSNAAFYEGRLITVPDRLLDGGHGALDALTSTAPEAAAQGVDALLGNPISYLKLTDGVYEARGNVAEAHFIAATIRELLNRETGHSIGIVAFSQAQQSQIEDALDALAAEDTAFAARLETEYVREDKGQFNGLFVKNLENVQGDERDIIVLSICYAPGPNGKMLMNFGPINQRGGEKRLNVIFSRARHRMAVVTSIQADAITNTHNDGAAALKGFLQFAHASASGETERSQHILGTLTPGARASFTAAPPVDAYRTALAQALRARGHTVHEHVGRSQFRCDLAIVETAGGGYRLGILLDHGGAAPTDVRERYVFRPGVLRSFGWTVIDVPSNAWLKDPDAVLARIEAALPPPAMSEA